MALSGTAALGRTGPIGGDAHQRAPRPGLPSLGSVLVLGWAFLLPVQLGGASGLRFAPSDLLIAAYAFLALPTLRTVRGVWSWWHLAVPLVIWFNLGRAMLGINGASRHAFLEKAVGILVLLVTYRCLVDYMGTFERVRAVLRAFLYGCLLNAGLSLVTFLGEKLGIFHVPMVNEPYTLSRPSGLLIDPNAFGGLMATALVLHGVTAAGGTPLMSRRAGRLATLCFPLALALTFSRSAWIGAFLGLVAVAVAQPRLVRRMLAPLVVPVGLVLPVLLVNLPNASGLAARPGQVTARLDILSKAVSDFAGSPLDGIGLGVYEQRHGVIVHNTAVWFLTEMGIIGLVVFLGFFLLHVRRATWLVTRGPAVSWVVGAALLAAMLVGLGVSLGIEAFYQRYWWLAFAAATAAFAAGRAEARA
jgi:putative inorganic carbon (hco3(-)) transporter